MKKDLLKLLTRIMVWLWAVLITGLGFTAFIIMKLLEKY